MSYKFKVEARTSFGYSDFSAEVEILCATVSDVTTVLTSTNVNDQVVFDWSAPVDNGLVITSYTVLIRNSENLWVENLDYCNA